MFAPFLFYLPIYITEVIGVAKEYSTSVTLLIPEKPDDLTEAFC